MNRADVRALAIDHARQLNPQTAEPHWETLLVADGRLRGYRFEFDGLRVFWFYHTRALEFYDADWRLLKVVEQAVAMRAA